MAPPPSDAVIEHARADALRAQRAAWQSGAPLPAPPPELCAIEPGPPREPRERWLWFWRARLAIEVMPGVAAARARALSQPGELALLGALATARNQAAASLFEADYPALVLASLALPELPELPDEPAIAKPPARRRAGRPEALVELLAGRGFELGPVTLAPGASAPGGRAFIVAADEVAVVFPPPVTDSGWRALCHELGHVWRARVAGLARGARWPAWEAPTRALEEGAAEWVADVADGVAAGRAVLGLGPDEAVARAAERRCAAVRRRRRTARRAALELALYRAPGSLAPHRRWRDLRWVIDPGAQWIYLAAEAERARWVDEVGQADSDGAAARAAALVTSLA